MRFRRTYGLALLTAVSAMVLTGCQGLHTAPLTNASSTIQLTVTSPASGSGTITSSPAGINCPTTCTASFNPNTQVTLTATPGTNFFFAGWSGSCTGTSTCVLTITAPATVAATFTQGDSLTVAIAPGGGTGTITSTPAGINCSATTTTTCSAAFPPNTQVTLAETPAAGSVFASWSGACTGSTTCAPTVTAAATSVTATFSLSGTLQSLNHIILFAQENRSLDHYFGAMQQYWTQTGMGAGQTFDGLPQFNTPAGLPPTVPGCDPTVTTSCNPDPANPIPSFHFKSICQENQSPFWNEAHNDWDYTDPSGLTTDTANPPLNGFVFTAAYDARSNNYNDVDGIRAMGYFDSGDLNYYYFMASNFATSDRWFAPVMSRTQINRMYMLSGTSQGYVYPIGSNAQDTKDLSAKTIFEQLQNAGITWKIYVNPAGTSDANGTPCSSVTPIGPCLERSSYINMFAYSGTILADPNLYQNIVPISQFATDVANGTLPQFAYIEPASNAGLDEHPSDLDKFPVNVQDGANYAAGLINELMNSPSWKDSAMIFTYDEAGGYYEHVPPQPVPSPDGIKPVDLQTSLNDICAPGTSTAGGKMCDFTFTGYRVPMIVISPFAKKNFVSHVVRDYTAVLNLVEERFGVPALTARDGYWSTTTPLATMDEFFDFVNVPWATPPSPPTQNRGGACSLVAPTP